MFFNPLQARSLTSRCATLLGTLACFALAASTSASPASAYRGVPVGLYNVNNQVMNSPDYVYGVRFVLDRDTTLYRFISGFNLEGTEQLGGRQGYSDGNGGTILARLVAVKPDGEPDLSQVLAQEKVGAWQRYTESKAAYGAPGTTQLLFFNMGGVQLHGGQMYAMTYQNVDPSPASNWFSENSPTVKESVAGPNGVNNTDPSAPGAIAGLDPREAVCWSQDGGSEWAWGRHAGEGDTPGAYGGSATGDDGTRLPWYGWQASPTSSPESNQPYYAYEERGSYTLKVSSVPEDVTLGEAGAYAPVGASAGVLTVRNLSTGAVGQTAELGSGLVRGALDNPVTVQAGQSYEISNTGTVMKAEGDSFVRSTFGIGTGSDAVTTVGNDDDMAQLFAESGRPGGHPAPPVKIIVRKATLADPASRAAGRAHARKRPSRLILIGRVTGSHPRHSVRFQLRFHGHWRSVGHAKPRRNGSFRLHRRTPIVDVRGGPLRARAILSGVGRSRTVHVAVRR
jgi:hypothetical protein